MKSRDNRTPDTRIGPLVRMLKSGGCAPSRWGAPMRRFDMMAGIARLLGVVVEGGSLYCCVWSRMINFSSEEFNIHGPRAALTGDLSTVEDEGNGLAWHGYGSVGQYNGFLIRHRSADTTSSGERKPEVLGIQGKVSRRGEVVTQKLVECMRTSPKTGTYYKSIHTMADIVITIIHYKPPPPWWYFSRAYRAPILLQSSPRLRGLQWTRRLGNKTIILEAIYDMHTEHDGGERRAGEEWEREDEDGSSGLGESILRPKQSGRGLAWVLDKRTYLEEARGEWWGGSHGTATVPRNLQEVVEGGREPY
ncbi:hypothetical protein DFH09DRAFT_1286314 [Mycena vulgaris]|nr:hypothetical protein DFH09DRAFT_1286314 [Mycena vulgaris]